MVELDPSMETARVELVRVIVAGPDEWSSRTKELADSGMSCERFYAGYCTSNVAAIDSQFSIREQGSDSVVGLVTYSDLDPHAGHVRLGVWTAESAKNLRRDAALLAVNHAFAMWRIERVYLRRSDRDEPVLADLAVNVGRLREFVFDDGALLDLEVCEVLREVWDSVGVYMLDAARQDEGAQDC